MPVLKYLPQLKKRDKVDSEDISDKELFELGYHLSKVFPKRFCPDQFRCKLYNNLMEEIRFRRSKQPHRLERFSAFFSIKRFSLRYTLSIVVALSSIFFLSLYTYYLFFSKLSEKKYGSFAALDVPYELLLPTSEIKFSAKNDDQLEGKEIPVFKTLEKILSESIATSLAKNFDFDEKNRQKGEKDFSWVKENHVLWFDTHDDSSTVYHFFYDKANTSTLAEVRDYKYFVDGFWERKTSGQQEGEKRNKHESFPTRYDAITSKLTGSVLKYTEDVLKKNFNIGALSVDIVPGELIDDTSIRQFLPSLFYVAYLQQTINSIPIFYESSSHPYETELSVYLDLSGNVIGFVYHDFLSTIDTSSYEEYPIIQAKNTIPLLKGGEGRLIFVQFLSDPTHFFYEPDESRIIREFDISHVNLYYGKKKERGSTFLIPIYIFSGTTPIETPFSHQQMAFFQILLPNALSREYVLKKNLSSSSFIEKNAIETFNITGRYTLTGDIVITAENIAIVNNTNQPLSGSNIIFRTFYANGNKEDENIPYEDGKALFLLNHQKILTVPEKVIAFTSDGRNKSQELLISLLPTEIATHGTVVAGDLVSLAFKQAPEQETVEEILTLTITETTEIFLNETKISMEKLHALRRPYGANITVVKDTQKERNVFILKKIVVKSFREEDSSLIETLKEGSPFTSPMPSPPALSFPQSSAAITEKPQNHHEKTEPVTIETAATSTNPLEIPQRTKITLTGLVTDKKTGQAIGSAKVTLVRDNKDFKERRIAEVLTAENDKKGYFSIQEELNPSLTYKLVVQKEGYHQETLPLEVSKSMSFVVEIPLSRILISFSAKLVELSLDGKVIEITSGKEKIKTILENEATFYDRDGGSPLAPQNIQPGSILTFSGFFDENNHFIIASSSIAVEQKKKLR